MASTKNFKRVFVWELPVRLFHWLNALSIVVLAITGFIIANPPAIMTSLEASESYWFGTVRFIHFAAAYVFVIVMILRIYWSFVGNKYAHWKELFPFNQVDRDKFVHVLKSDIILLNDEEDDYNNISVGHNSVAAFSYLAMFIMAIIMVITGFGLYAPTGTWWFTKLFSWVVPFFGGDFLVRTIHHITMWSFILFTLVHIYLVFYHDWLEGRGEVSSMFGGYKFVRKERVAKQKNKKKQKD